MTAVAEDLEAEQSVRPTLLAALLVIASLIAAALGWGLYARLGAAITTHGDLLAESERKTVEHLEGGILHRLMSRPASG